MKDFFENYIASISSKFSHLETSEMGYRTDFEILIKGIFESVNVKRIDHDAKVNQGNKPDFVILNHDIPILYIEAKDIGVSLDKVEKSDQMTRYYGYANLVLTDYTEFRFYRNGARYQEPIKIADYDLKNRIIRPIPENYENVSKTLIDFSKSHKEPIRSGKHLSRIMGGKARRIRDNARQFLLNYEDKNADLNRVYETIKKLLVHDLTAEAFSDMYAQTLVYGLFVARYYDDSPNSFTRQEARDLIPNSNPLLRHFFDHIVGPNFDKRLEYIVNELCEVFSHADIQELMKEYFKDDLWGESHKGPDPVIHFYEDFLKEYDDELRKKMGAYYTPSPVVQFIVRSVDSLLQKEFGLVGGLANNSKSSDGIHRVQILDPAVGTGTFLTEVLQNVYSKFTDQVGRWPAYVYQDLLPRLHGFELMMAPYTIAHLKMSMWLKTTGFKHFNSARLGVYLTNSLEGGVIHPELLAFDFAASVAEEAKVASKIKNEKPIMVVVGNPPYSGHSSNKGIFEQEINDYKVEFDGKKLQERNSKWLNDDYVKFIRFGELMIEKKGEGILAFITNHAYIDNPTFRGMRHHLLQTFDDIYIIDLHGNAKKKELADDGSQDQNVFDIQQGVAIIIAVKNGKKNKESLGTLYKKDIYGKRDSKFIVLNESNIDTLDFLKVNLNEPSFLFKEVDLQLDKEYKKGFSIGDFFIQNSVGIVTSKDATLISDSEEGLEWQIKKYFENEKSNMLFDKTKIRKISYRPFDSRFIYYDLDLIERAREKIMRNFEKENLGLISVRQVKSGENYSHVLVSDKITESTFVSNKTSEIGYVFPLFIYGDDGSRSLNLEKETIGKIEEIVGEVGAEDIFDYIYASLHSAGYREKYREFLKVDFPRVPYPKNLESFKKLSTLGKELRSLHLLETSQINKIATSYPESGSNIVEKITYRDSKVYINENQYVGNVPEIAWNFYIGSYQPAQKWLKDRKGKSLQNSDIEHYQEIISVLLETNRLMGEIDRVF